MIAQDLDLTALAEAVGVLQQPARPHHPRRKPPAGIRPLRLVPTSEEHTK